MLLRLRVFEEFYMYDDAYVWGAALTARFGHPFVFSVSTIVFFDTDLCQAKGLAHWSVLVGEVKLLSWM